MLLTTDRERLKSELKNNGNIIKTTIFAGSYEKVTQNGITKELYYIAGADSLCSILVKQSGQADKFYYVHPDHLGSLAIITDASGSIAQKRTNYRDVIHNI